MRAPRVNDLYVMNMSNASTSSGSAQCFISRASERESVLWNRRMGHISLRKMNHLVHKNLVEGVSLRNFQLSEEYLDCKKGKQTKKSHPGKLVNSINLPFERLHIDLFGPVNVKSITGELYCLVVTDYYSRFSWVMFLESKDETYDSLMVLFKKLENLYNLPIRRIRSDNGTEFKNNRMIEYCNDQGILHEFKAVAAACYTLNRVLTIKKFGKTCFELLNRRKPNLKWLEPFGSTCIVLEPSGKFGPKSVEGFFVGYASPLRRVYIPNLHKIIQLQNVDCQRYTPNFQRPGDSRLFDYDSLWEIFKLPEEDFSEENLTMIYNQQFSENQVIMHEEPASFPPNIPDHVQSDDVPETVPVFDDNDDSDEEIIEAISPSTVTPKLCENNLQSEVSVHIEVVPRTVSYHPEQNIIRDLNARVEPKTYKEALTKESCVNAMQEELMQFEKLRVWKLVDLPEDKSKSTLNGYSSIVKKVKITDPKHNICAYLNEEDPKAANFRVIMPFLKRS
ncbi:uncharacterized protein LOC143561389 [Bidens hawaiensis]|uniref:uncharacterized protein LOC143561389 n=1 Tax=Bidens hawaiensis TaxID=980011 RepID=UPI0040495459